MKYTVNEELLKGLKGPDREEFKTLIVNNKKLLDKVVEILYNRGEGKRDTVLSDYDTPSWSHKQAHLNGEIAALKKMVELLTVQERDDPPTT